MADQIPSSPDAVAEPPEVRVEGDCVVLRAAGGAELRLTPEAADRAAERLWEAAEQARGAPGSGDRPKPPFPPHELVSPHAAG
jgi:hypothetical protein